MSQPFRQESFAGGIFSPRLWGRTGLAKYFVALRQLLNFFVAPEGAALNRAGTWKSDECKDSAAAVDRPARLIPFIFSEDVNQAYALEFGHLYLRFHVNGATIADPGNPAIPLEVVTPFTSTDLPFIKYAQQGDLVTLTCVGHDPQELKRLSHTNWSIGPVTFNVPAPNGPAYVRHTSIYDTTHQADASHPKKQWQWQITEIWADQDGLEWETSPNPVTLLRTPYYEAWNQFVTYPAGAFASDGGTQYRSLAGGNLGQIPHLSAGWWVVDGTVTAPPPAFTDPIPDTLVLYPDKTVDLYVPTAWGLTVATGAKLIGRRVYRGRGDAFGYVGEFTGLTFTDVGDLPDLTRTPPQGLNPFNVYDASNALVRVEQPSVVTYQDQRRVFLGTAQRPAYAFLSRVGDYYNFDRHSPKVADDAFELELAGRKREQVRWAVGFTALMVGTQSSLWAVDAVTGKVLAPGDAEAKNQGDVGSSWLDPLIVPPDVLLFSRTKGTGIRDLVYDNARQRFIGSDLVLLARHLFTGHKIVSWCYAEDPWSVAWVVRDDGVLLSLTYVRDQEVWAWAQHATQGLVESVCSIPEGGEDALYLIVKRQKGDGTWHRYVERMASRVVPAGSVDGREMLFLDSAVSLTNLAPGAPVSGLGHLEGLQVVALADGDVVRVGADGDPLVVTGGQVTLPDDDGAGFGIVHCGLPYLSDLELLDLASQQQSVRNQVKQVTKVAFEVESSRGMLVAERLADDKGVPTPDAEWNEWDQREVEDDFGTVPLFTGLVELSVFSSWNRKGRAALRQTEPLPCCILAVTREADVGGS